MRPRSGKKSRSDDIDHPMSIGTILLNKFFDISKVMPTKKALNQRDCDVQKQSRPKNTGRIQTSTKPKDEFNSRVGDSVNGGRVKSK